MSFYDDLDKKIKECLEWGEGHIEIFIFTQQDKKRYRIRGGKTLNGSLENLEED
jgi:hypothetical protein